MKNWGATVRALLVHRVPVQVRYDRASRPEGARVDSNADGALFLDEISQIWLAPTLRVISILRCAPASPIFQELGECCSVPQLTHTKLAKLLWAKTGGLWITVPLV